MYQEVRFTDKFIFLDGKKSAGPWFSTYNYENFENQGIGDKR